MKKALAIVVLAAAGCSSVSVSTDYDRDVDFARMRTFAWMPPAPSEPDPFGSNTIVKKRVTSAIESELASKSISRTDGSPDFLVAVHGFVRDRLDVTSWPYGWGRRGMWGSQRVEVSQYSEGTLVLDFVNPASKELLWRGAATSALDSSSGSPQHVDEAIHKLLDGFPPPAK